MSRPSVHAAPIAALDDYQWLTGRDAGRRLEDLASSSRPLPAEMDRLRRTLTPTRAHLLVEQVELRKRAGAKFAAADRMFFARRALEQATDEVVAAYKAARFAAGRDAWDLCCGIGGDLLALAQTVNTVGFDRDPIVAILARANARLLVDDAAAAGRDDVARVLVRDVAELDLAECAAWHIDPDRRPTGRRTTRVALHEPDVDVLERLLARNGNAAIKLAPAAEVPETWIESAQLEWIGRDRQCRQLVAWFGDLAQVSGQRRATVLHNTQAPPRTVVGSQDENPPAIEPAIGTVKSYVLEPDAAVLAAGLGPTLAKEHGLARISTGIAYWTGDVPIVDAALACFEVLELLPLDVKRLKSLLRARRIGRLEIKKRGVDQRPETLRQKLQLAGDESATLIVTRVASRVTAIVARRVGTANSGAQPGP